MLVIPMGEAKKDAYKCVTGFVKRGLVAFPIACTWQTISSIVIKVYTMAKFGHSVPQT